MSDLGCWRQGNHLVVRYYGSEHLMTEADASELIAHIDNVLWHGFAESLGEGYKALRARPKPTRLFSISGLRSAFGLDKPSKPLRRL